MRTSSRQGSVDNGRSFMWRRTGLASRVEEYWKRDQTPAPAEVDNAFWCACHGAQVVTASYLLERGANLNWLGHDNLTPLDAASRSGAEELAQWLRGRGARSAKEL